MSDKKTAMLVTIDNDERKGKVYFADLHLEPCPVYIVDENFQETNEKILKSRKVLTVVRFFH